MSISDWFKARELRRYTTPRGAAPRRDTASGADADGGSWVACPACRRIVHEEQLGENARVCPQCGHHFAMSADERIALMADSGSFVEMDASVVSADPLAFVDTIPYTERLLRAREASGLREAVVTGRATISGHPVVLGVLDFRFVGASMGSAVGEKVTRAFESAIADQRSVVLFTASGGARMQEGMFSLLQMAKTADAVRRFAETRLPYISVLTNPTMGGVTASFAVRADIIFAEPHALVGFAGPRVIEQTIRQSLPKGFQSAEFLASHGFVDAVVPRGQLLARVGLVLDYLAGGDRR